MAAYHMGAVLPQQDFKLLKVADIYHWSSDRSVAAGPILIGNITFGDFTISQAFSAYITSPHYSNSLTTSHDRQCPHLAAMRHTLVIRVYSV